MKIAITADPMLPVPPRLYGGIERIIAMLIDGLVERGHDVTLFAHGESDVPCRLVSYGSDRPRGALPLLRNTASVSRLLVDRPDVVHSFGRLAYLTPLLPASIPKIMSYQREPSLRQIGRAMQLAKSGSMAFTGCSDYIARQIAPLAPSVAIHNGVPLRRFTPRYSVAPDAPLVFLGRLERIKGAHTAIRVARASGRKLVVAGNRVDDDQGRRYYETEIAPNVDGEQVRFIGPIDDAKKNELLGEAAALLMPIEWEEPFGIVMAEALACGTPVLAFSRGAVPEVVTTGVNGFACDDETEMTALVSRLNEIDRRRCRADCEARFGDSAIVGAYERLYQERVRCLAS